jgi:hypothetical protein
MIVYCSKTAKKVGLSQAKGKKLVQRLRLGFSPKDLRLEKKIHKKRIRLWKKIPQFPSTYVRGLSYLSLASFSVVVPPLILLLP